MCSLRFVVVEAANRDTLFKSLGVLESTKSVCSCREKRSSDAVLPYAFRDF